MQIRLAMTMAHHGTLQLSSAQLSLKRSLHIAQCSISTPRRLLQTRDIRITRSLVALNTSSILEGLILLWDRHPSAACLKKIRVDQRVASPHIYTKITKTPSFKKVKVKEK
jgi:hypothetical protein